MFQGFRKSRYCTVTRLVSLFSLNPESHLTTVDLQIGLNIVHKGPLVAIDSFEAL